MAHVQSVTRHRRYLNPSDLAYRLDREADAALSWGQVSQAERLSHRAVELRATSQMPEQLAVQDERRLRLGVQHAIGLGDRAMANLLVQVVQERRDIAGVLDLLDQWRSQMTVGMVCAAGGDRWPTLGLREAAR